MTIENKHDYFCMIFESIDIGSQTITDTDFESCIFQGCNFYETVLTHCHFVNCIFFNCNTDKTDFRDSTLYGIQFINGNDTHQLPLQTSSIKDLGLTI